MYFLKAKSLAPSWGGVWQGSNPSKDIWIFQLRQNHPFKSITPIFFYNVKKKSDIQYKYLETYQNKVQKVKKSLNDKVKFWNLIKNKN